MGEGGFGAAVEVESCSHLTLYVLNISDEWHIDRRLRVWLSHFSGYFLGFLDHCGYDTVVL